MIEEGQDEILKRIDESERSKEKQCYTSGVLSFGASHIPNSSCSQLGLSVSEYANKPDGFSFSPVSEPE